MEKQELLHAQTSANTTDNSNYSKSQDDTSFEFVEKTPFAIMKRNGTWSITMGNYIVIDNLNTKQEALNKIRKKDWDIIITATAIYQEILKEFQKKQENKNKN
jgi:hypothetical protein